MMICRFCLKGVLSQMCIYRPWIGATLAVTHGSSIVEQFQTIKLASAMSACLSIQQKPEIRDEEDGQYAVCDPASGHLWVSDAAL